MELDPSGVLPSNWQAMEVFVSPVTDPRVNLGLESFFLNQFAEEGCLVYRNAPSIIIGKNQNPYREVDVGFCKKQQLPVLRRISGGGTVYHDLGNINTAFFGRRRGIADNLYKRWTVPPLDFLHSLGILVERDGRNGLELNGRKVSGSAQALKKERYLHHATLLYASDLATLGRSLTPMSGLVDGRGISSIRSPVANIIGFSVAADPVQVFLEAWVAYLAQRFGRPGAGVIPYAVGAEIQRSVQEQFGCWEWNQGKTPRYTYRLPFAEDHLNFEVNHGRIEDMYWNKEKVTLRPALLGLIGQRFTADSLLNAGVREFCPELEDLVF